MKEDQEIMLPIYREHSTTLKQSITKKSPNRICYSLINFTQYAEQ